MHEEAHEIGARAIWPAPGGQVEGNGDIVGLLDLVARTGSGHNWSAPPDDKVPHLLKVQWSGHG